MSLAPPPVKEVVALLDHKLASIVGRNEITLQQMYGLDVLVPVYVDAFRHIRHSHGRVHILFWLIKYARSNPTVVELAKYALADKSHKVRCEACGILAYAKHMDSIAALQELLKHPNNNTRQDAEAAINAISHQNHHLFVDRRSSGTTFWIVNSEDETGTQQATPLDSSSTILRRH